MSSNNQNYPLLGLTTLLALLLILAGGCKHRLGDIAASDIDNRRGSDRCELHHSAMQTARVGLTVGCVLPLKDYLEARKESFPNTCPNTLRAKNSFELIYVCDQCLAREREWLA